LKAKVKGQPKSKAKVKGQSQKPKLKANDKKLKHNLLELPNPTSLSIKPL
jgi:hypothetical protein